MSTRSRTSRDRSRSDWAPQHDQHGGASGAAGRLALPLPDKPSIAVLPFTNISGDPEQEYLSDGITADIITALSRIGWFFVIARNSSFTFKERAVEVGQIAEQLGVRDMLEGSVRKSANRLRVTAHLIDAETRGHIWADQYDGIFFDRFLYSISL